MDAGYAEPQGAPQADQAGCPLSWFYAAPRKSEPWNPHGLVYAASLPDQAGTYAPPPQLAPDLSFGKYRSAASSSVCSSLVLGDSGYGGSRHTYSIDSASIHGDDAALDLQIGQAMGDCQISQAGDSLGPQQLFQAHGKHECPECHTCLKSQGELK